MTDLRAACIHGRYEDCDHEIVAPVVGHPEKAQLVPCPGGRAVTLDYEAANEALTHFEHYTKGLATYPFGDREAAKAIVDVALLVTDE